MSARTVERVANAIPEVTRVTDPTPIKKGTPIPISLLLIVGKIVDKSKKGIKRVTPVITPNVKPRCGITSNETDKESNIGIPWMGWEKPINKKTENRLPAPITQLDKIANSKIATVSKNFHCNWIQKLEPFKLAFSNSALVKSLPKKQELSKLASIKLELLKLFRIEFFDKSSSARLMIRLQCEMYLY